MSGAYRDTATIQQDSSLGGTATPDYSGAALLTGWPCKVTTVSGDSSYRGRMLEAQVNYVVEGQYYAGITPTMRLSMTGGIHSGKVFNIATIRTIEGNGKARKLELYCEGLAGR
jgi:hypothetical protein